MPTRAGFAFGSFSLDIDRKRLLRGDEDVPLSVAHFEVLHLLVRHAGRLVTKEQFIATVWPDVAVSDNALNQAISRLRSIQDSDGRPSCIETLSRRGYRFLTPVTPCEFDAPGPDLDTLLAPHRAFMDGRAALESLDLEGIARARQTFERLIASHSSDASFHVGLAMACALQFESTRADAAPDTGALTRAVTCASEACRLSPESSDAWGALGFVLLCTGDRVDASAALRRAIAIDPSNWRHHLRLAVASWGSARLQAAQRTRSLMPNCEMACWLAATVFVARGAFAEADRELGGVAGIALHWLKGLMRLARGADADALADFERELALESRGHLYAREIAANTWYAIGACHLQHARHELARAAFTHALTRVPAHACACAGLAILDGRDLTRPPGAHESFEWAMARAAVRVARGELTGAVADLTGALAAAPPGSAGWTLPLDPLLRVHEARDDWAEALAVLAKRAM